MGRRWRRQQRSFSRNFPPADPLAESTAAIVPEAPTYGSGLDKRDPRTPATSASWEPPTGGSTVPTSLSSTGFPVGNRVESASGSEGSVANSPPSAGQPYDVHENAAATATEFGRPRRGQRVIGNRRGYNFARERCE